MKKNAVANTYLIHDIEEHMHNSKEREHLALERMLFFSDAVFAISITLLILEIKVPFVQQEFSELKLWYALLQMTPQIAGFLISFFLIGQTWIEHHRMCSLLVEYNSGMLWKNLWLLLFVVFLPFATALMSEYYFSRVAICIYTISFAGLVLQKPLFGITQLKSIYSQRILMRNSQPESVAVCG